MNDEIQNLLDAYERGLNEGDPMLIRSVYADDAIFIGQPFPTATGIDEIIALYSDFLSTLDFDVQFEVQESRTERRPWIRSHSVSRVYHAKGSEARRRRGKPRDLRGQKARWRVEVLSLYLQRRGLTEASSMAVEYPDAQTRATISPWLSEFFQMVEASVDDERPYRITADELLRRLLADGRDLGATRMCGG